MLTISNSSSTETQCVESIIQAVTSIMPHKNFLPLHEPDLGEDEIHYLSDCIKSGYVSSVGQYVNEFEAQIAQITQSPFAVATMNGTAALHLCYLLSGVKSHDEVLLCPLTFVATANAIRYCNAIPHFIDCETHTLSLDIEGIRNYLNETAILEKGALWNRNTGRRIHALCTTHIFGHPTDLDAIKTLCHEYSLQLIEDAAEALGSYYKHQHVGNTGVLSAVSFNGNKIITTGGGGALLTHHEELAQRAKHITQTAKMTHRWRYIHNEVGYNYRLPNLNAALGCAQLNKFEKILHYKKTVAQHYRNSFKNSPYYSFFESPDYGESNFWLNTLLLKPDLMHLRDSIIDQLNDAGIGARGVWEPLHHLPMYQDTPRMPLNNVENFYQRIINLPSGLYLNG